MRFYTNGYHVRPSRLSWGDHQAAEHVAMSVETTVGLPSWAAALVIAAAILLAVATFMIFAPDADGMAGCQLQHSFDTCHMALVG